MECMSTLRRIVLAATLVVVAIGCSAEAKKSRLLSGPIAISIPATMTRRRLST